MIKVKTLTGKEIEIDIEPTDTIDRIKERVEEKEGIPPVQQRFVMFSRLISRINLSNSWNLTAYWFSGKCFFILFKVIY